MNVNEFIYLARKVYDPEIGCFLVKTYDIDRKTGKDEIREDYLTINQVIDILSEVDDKFENFIKTNFDDMNKIINLEYLASVLDSAFRFLGHNNKSTIIFKR